MCISFSQVIWSLGVAKKVFIFQTLCHGILTPNLDCQASCVLLGGLKVLCVKKYVILFMVSSSRTIDSPLTDQPCVWGKVVFVGPLILSSGSRVPISCCSLYGSHQDTSCGLRSCTLSIMPVSCIAPIASIQSCAYCCAPKHLA